MRERERERSLEQKLRVLSVGFIGVTMIAVGAIVFSLLKPVGADTTPGTCLPIEKGGTGCNYDTLRTTMGLGELATQNFNVLDRAPAYLFNFVGGSSSTTTVDITATQQPVPFPSGSGIANYGTSRFSTPLFTLDNGLIAPARSMIAKFEFNMQITLPATAPANTQYTTCIYRLAGGTTSQYDAFSCEKIFVPTAGALTIFLRAERLEYIADASNRYAISIQSSPTDVGAATIRVYGGQIIVVNPGD